VTGEDVRGGLGGPGAYHVLVFLFFCRSDSLRGKDILTKKSFSCKKFEAHQNVLDGNKAEASSFYFECCLRFYSVDFISIRPQRTRKPVNYAASFEGSSSEEEEDAAAIEDDR